MSQTTLKLSVLATLLLLTGGISANAGDETFTVRIENASAANALKLSNGKTEPVGVAPVLYVVHTNRAPLFTSGEPDRGKGLEALAEDGPTGPLEKSLRGQPGIVHSRSCIIDGEAVACDDNGLYPRNSKAGLDCTLQRDVLISHPPKR
jgi:hypothetical protein